MGTRGHIITAGVILVGIGGVLAGLWLMVRAATVDTLRWWAGLATLALPMAALAGYRLGLLAARERIAGLETGVEKVMAAARQTASLRYPASQRQSRAKVPQAAFNVFLPGYPGSGPQQPVVLPRLSDGEDVVEL